MSLSCQGTVKDYQRGNSTLISLLKHCIDISTTNARMLKLINPPQGTEYVDLTVSFSVPGEDDDKPIPPIRYFLQ